MPGGDLPDYSKKYHDADRFGLVGVPLLFLSHAHSRYQLSGVANDPGYPIPVVTHGDLNRVRGCPKSSFAALLTSG